MVIIASLLRTIRRDIGRSITFGVTRCVSGVSRALFPWAFAASTLTAACKDAPEPAAAAPAVAVADTPRAPAPGDPTCPRDGLWKSCALVDRVSHAGFFFKAAGDTTTVPYLKAKGVRYTVGSATTLLAFYYADTLELARDWAKIDTLRLTVPGDTIGPWPSIPDVMRSANLIAAFFTGDPLKRERMRLAITAGAPQPPSAAAQALPVQQAR